MLPLSFLPQWHRRTLLKYILRVEEESSPIRCDEPWPTVVAKRPERYGRSRTRAKQKRLSFYIFTAAGTGSEICILSPNNGLYFSERAKKRKKERRRNLRTYLYSLSENTHAHIRERTFRIRYVDVFVRKTRIARDLRRRETRNWCG